MRSKCKRHRCQHDQVTQNYPLAVCDLCGHQVDAWGPEVLDGAVEFDLGGWWGEED